MGKQNGGQRFRTTPRRNPGTGGVTLQTTFGLPPDNLEPRTNEMIKKSVPVAGVFPSTPVFQKGLDYLRDTESSNTKDMNKKKMQFKLTKTEIDKLIAERDASARHSGLAEKLWESDIAQS